MRRFQNIMTKTTLSIASALVIGMSIPAAQASHKKVEATPATQAQLILRDIENMANKARDEVNPLERLGYTLSTESHLQHLTALRTDVNAMSREISRLDAEVEALTPGEKETVQKVEPLIKETVEDTQKAITFFNRNRDGMWRDEYRGYINGTLEGSERIAATVKEYLQYAKTHGDARPSDGALGAGGQ